MQKKQPKPAGKQINTPSALFALKPWMLPAVLIVTLISFWPSLNNGLVFWDDPEYVTNNPFIKEFSFKKIFSLSPPAYYMANYHPLTIASYCLEYKLFGLNNFMFHLDNILLHLANTALVFFFVQALFRKRFPFIALFSAMLFGIHPMHVESVTWVSERKDVLYTLFYLLALLYYVKYVQQNRNLKWLVIAFAMTLLSLLAKGQAVTIPVVFLLIDFLNREKINGKLILEKIPFFALALAFGILAIKAQGAGEAINANYSEGLVSIFWGCYGLALYIWKFFVPIDLSGLHPYPLGPNLSAPGYVYASILVPVALLIIIWKTIKAHREITFGIAFFVFAIAPMLKFLPVGDAILGERYTYIPYIGLFIAIGYLIQLTLEKPEWSKNKTLIFLVVGIYVLVLSVLTFNRTKVWKDSFAFWGNVLEQYPNYWRGNHCLAQEYYQIGEYQKAYDYYTKAIVNDPYCPPPPYLWRGATLLDKLGKPDLSVADFKRVIALSHSKTEQIYTEANFNLGLAYYRMGDYAHADSVHQNLLTLMPENPKLHYHMGLVYAAQKKLDEAIRSYGKSLELNPNQVEPLLNRGSIYTDQLNQFDLAVADFKRVLELKPGEPDAMTNIGVTLYKQRKFDEAIAQYNTVLQGYPNNGRVYYLRALAWSEKQEFAKAVEDANKAVQMGVGVPQELINSWKR